jgi:sugar phosphate isomerase/epimerase
MADNIQISAFADEAGSDLAVQIKALNDAGIGYIEIRGVDGKPFTDRTPAEAKIISDTLAASGIKIRSLGSPCGKISVKDDFAPHLDLFKRTVELGNTVGAECIRLFSFYIPEGDRPEDHRDTVLERLSAFCDAAKGSGLYLCHENEKGIYGDVAVRCAELMAELPDLHSVFDSANFIQAGQDVRQAWTILKNRVHYIHVKDATADGTIVPAGEGIGLYREILSEYSKRGGGGITLEPHLAVFDGLAGLEREGEKSNVGSYSFNSNEEAFAAGVKYLKGVLANI